MIKEVKFWDRVMFGALLVLVIFIPYSAAMTQAGLFVMMLAWIVKHSLIRKNNPQQGWIVSYKFPSHGLFWPLLVIGFLIVVTIPVSHAPALSLKKFFSRFIQQIFLMYCIAEIINTPKRLYQILVVFLWTLVVVNTDIFVQYFRGHSFIFHTQMLFQRVSGPMRHPNDLGTLLVTTLPVVLSLLITRRFWVSLLFGPRFTGMINVLGWVLFMCSVTALGLSVSRGAWVAFAVSMLGYGLYLKNYRLTGSIVLVLVLFFWIFSMNCINVRTDISPKAANNFSINEEISQGLGAQETLVYNPAVQDAGIQRSENAEEAPLKEEDYSNQKVFFNFSSRDVYWKTAIDMIKQHPLTGCGYNAYIQTLKINPVGHEEYPHNSLLHITAELGILGLVAYLWFFGALFLKGVRILKSISFHKDLYILGVGLLFGLLAWWIHSLLDTPWESLLLNILWWTLIGILLSLGAIAQQMKAIHKGKV